MTTNDFNGGRYVLPSIEERTRDGVKITDPYSKLFESRIIFLAAPIDAASASDIVAQILALDHMDSTQDINIYINSPGGSVTDVSMIIDAISLVKCEVATLCLGRASEVAALLVAAGTKGKRSALPNSKFMIQEPSSIGSGRGQQSDLEIYTRQLVEAREWAHSFLADRTGRSIEAIAKETIRANHMSAQEALDYGLIDYIQ